jgi:hypothetical protein
VNYTRHNFIDGGLSNAELHADNHWDWENGNRIDTALNGSWEGFRAPFEIHPGVIVPVGEHGGLRFRMVANTDARKWASARLQWEVGRFLTGDQNSPTLQVVLRDSGRLTVATNWAFRSITLPEGSFRTNLGNMRVTYNFSPSVFVQSLLQYNDRTDRWSTNLRFHWLETAGSGLFVVYNDPQNPRSPWSEDRCQTRASSASKATPPVIRIAMNGPEAQRRHWPQWQTPMPRPGTGVP